jgi:hypothetical protein
MTWGLRPVSDLPPFHDGKPFCRSRLSLGVARLLARSLAAVRLLIIDEAAHIDEELYHALRPMLAVSGGSLLLASTPYGQVGPFPHAWFYGGDAWHRESVPSTECPRISMEFLEGERATMPDQIFRREYMCSFDEADTQVFSEELIQSIVDDDLIPEIF